MKFPTLSPDGGMDRMPYFVAGRGKAALACVPPDSMSIGQTQLWRPTWDGSEQSWIEYWPVNPTSPDYQPIYSEHFRRMADRSKPPQHGFRLYVEMDGILLVEATVEAAGSTLTLRFD